MMCGSAKPMRVLPGCVLALRARIPAVGWLTLVGHTGNLTASLSDNSGLWDSLPGLGRNGDDRGV